jgi:hypothetical protein
LRQQLDHDGCAYGQVTRERLAHTLERVEDVNRKLNWMLMAIVTQVLSLLGGCALLVIAKGWR